MEYTPRYPQPFTLSQAVGLDVSTITEEIARLQNSLSHLRSTQEQLKDALAEDPDPEFTKAVEENQVTIGSQEERISILRMALAEKGVLMNEHYAVETTPAVPPPEDTPDSTSRATQSAPPLLPRQPTAPEHTTSNAARTVPQDVQMDEDGGLHL